MILENKKQIAAPQSIIWNTTVDVEQWPEWTPTVQRVERLDEGPFRLGSVAQIKQPGMPVVQWRVTELVEGERFTWETRIRGIRMVASHTLTPVGSDTQCTLRIEMTGLAAMLLWPLLRLSVGKALEQENAGLKATCEALVDDGEKSH